MRLLLLMMIDRHLGDIKAQTKGGRRIQGDADLLRKGKKIVGCQSFGNVSKHGYLLVVYFLLSPFYNMILRLNVYIVNHRAHAGYSPWSPISQQLGPESDLHHHGDPLIAGYLV